MAKIRIFMVEAEGDAIPGVLEQFAAFVRGDQVITQVVEPKPTALPTITEPNRRIPAAACAAPQLFVCGQCEFEKMMLRSRGQCPKCKSPKWAPKGKGGDRSGDPAFPQRING